MSLLKSNSVQIGQSATATQNFTLSVPSSPDGTIKLARGNSGATTQDILTVNSSGAVTLTNGGAITLATAQNSTSGTAIDFTGIPSWVKRVTVMLNGISTSGADDVILRVGSGSFASSGYAGSSGYFGSPVAVERRTDSFGVCETDLSQITHGNLILCTLGSNVWAYSSVVGRSTSDYVLCAAGSVTLGGSLDRLRITTTGGTDTFDAGSINIMYEG
jgi:hypothetical protein